MMARLARIVSLLRDPRTPGLPRLAVILAIVYLLWPVDLLPEFVVPVVGWFDDLTVVWLALRWLVRSDPQPPPPELGPGGPGAIR
jgi:uncharacterized membrane protein YkvA (DUF1232 family)